MNKIYVGLQGLKILWNKCKDFFAEKDHDHLTATEDRNGFMSSASVKKIEAISEKLDELTRVADFDGGEPSDTNYTEGDLDGGEPESTY